MHQPSRPRPRTRTRRLKSSHSASSRATSLSSSSPCVALSHASLLHDDAEEPSATRLHLLQTADVAPLVQAIRDWLHDPTSLRPVEIRRGYLPDTKAQLKQLRRTGAKAPKGLVTALDPDSLVRARAADDGARLEHNDAAYERALLRSLFEYVRAGELDLAIDLCRQSDQSWRAAGLSGGKLWFDPVLAPDDEDDDDFAMLDGAERDRRVQGNANRRLWKTMCRKLAATVRPPPLPTFLQGSPATSRARSLTLLLAPHTRRLLSTRTSARCTARCRATSRRSCPSAARGRTSCGRTPTP